MNKPIPNPAEGQLSTLLREARPAPGMPPRFQENVWRRIEDQRHTRPAISWVEALATLVLRPRFAFTAVAALVLAGVWLGSLDGNARVRHDAQQRYVAAVALHGLH